MLKKGNIITHEMSNAAILEDLGAFIKQTRLAKNKTQLDVATAAGIKRMTLARIEKGEGGTMETFIRVLRALDQLHTLRTFEVPTLISPMQLMKLQEQPRQRATKTKSIRISSK